MVHTVSGITLHRLRRMAEAGDAPYEAALRRRPRWSTLVRELDPLFFEKVGLRAARGRRAARGGVPARRATMATRSRASSTRGSTGASSRLVRRVRPAPRRSSPMPCARPSGCRRRSCATTRRIDRVLNPARNRYRLDVLNVSYHSPLMRTLHHATYMFAKRLSHTADSQDQRHRMVPASRPLMTLRRHAAPDYVDAAADRGEPAAQADVRPGDARTRGRRRTGCSRSACRSSSRCTSCRTRRPCG